MGNGGLITKLLRNVSVIPKLKICVIPNSHRGWPLLLELLQGDRGRHEQLGVQVFGLAEIMQLDPGVQALGVRGDPLLAAPRTVSSAGTA